MLSLWLTRIFTFLLLLTPHSFATPLRPPPTPVPTRKPPPSNSSLPSRIMAGVSVIDTPIVRSAQAYARQHSSDFVYKHIMRSWLFGVLMIDANHTLRATTDREIHAVAVLLHDLGWDQTVNSSVVSADRRFEVDGAIAARDFIRHHADGRRWEERRVQLVWDAIALHSEQRIAYFKELDVQVVSKGISMDFEGPGLGVGAEAYDAVVRAFPKDDFKTGFNETMVWLCRTKPAATYDTWMQPWGDRYVADYASEGNLRIDTIFSKL
ncbi:hypothetical protein C8A00DRAFT_17902 [Chaetomidium leptoderma]|uniref:HD domain-containing protein n=1 Tax=Chaetomidium leptoderma TaxID=669021 RepID=A0AAN6ZUD2_9PEZI|nr:hypothetical protein C8A00DRAFT_17902 [Chaetomidium leptoderma]